MIKSNVFRRSITALAAIVALIVLVNIMDNFSWGWFFVICIIALLSLLLVPELFGLEWKGRGSKYDKD